VIELNQAIHLPAAASFKHCSPAGAAVSVPLTAAEALAYEITDPSKLSPMVGCYDDDSDDDEDDDNGGGGDDDGGYDEDDDGSYDEDDDGGAADGDDDDDDGESYDVDDDGVDNDDGA
jgi:hypothetical protein